MMELYWNLGEPDIWELSMFHNVISEVKKLSLPWNKSKINFRRSKKTFLTVKISLKLTFGDQKTFLTVKKRPIIVVHWDSKWDVISLYVTGNRKVYAGLFIPVLPHFRVEPRLAMKFPKMRLKVAMNIIQNRAPLLFQ